MKNADVNRFTDLLTVQLLGTEKKTRLHPTIDERSFCTCTPAPAHVLARRNALDNRQKGNGPIELLALYVLHTTRRHPTQSDATVEPIGIDCLLRRLLEHLFKEHGGRDLLLKSRASLNEFLRMQTAHSD